MSTNNNTDESSSHKGIRQMYHALELRQYSKALKLSYAKPQCDWPVAIALRAHSLERLGRVMDSLCTVRDLITALFPHSAVDWRGPIDEKIWMCKQLGDSSNTTTDPSLGTKANTGKVVESTSFKSWSLMDVLDLPRWKRREIVQSSSLDTNQSHESMTLLGGMEAILRETTVETITLCLKQFRLYETIAHVHIMALDVIQVSNLLNPLEKKDILVRYLEQVYHYSLLAAYEYHVQEYTSSDVDPIIHEGTGMIQAIERAQSASMQLVRHTSEKLYSYWSAHAILLHWDCANSIGTILDSHPLDDPSHSTEQVMELRQKLQVKRNMLPRLAETILRNFTTAIPHRWDDGSTMYIQALQLQGKFSEVISFIHNILENPNFTPQTDSLCPSKSQNVAPWMALADTFVKMGRFQDAFNVYANHLLPTMPDQWSYWEQLLDSSIKGSKSVDDALLQCSKVLQSIYAESHDQPRTAHLFYMELEFQRLEKNLTANSEPLCISVMEYIHRFAPNLFCCFEDVRKYVKKLACPLCNNSTSSETDNERLIHNSLEMILSRAKASFDNYSSDESGSVPIMVYLCWLKVCLEIWYQLLSCHDMAMNQVNEVMQPFIPTVDDILSTWRSSLNSGNQEMNNNGDYSPFDDFIQLSVQILLHQASFTMDDKQRYATRVIATTLLEYAMSHSPLNPYLKIAAIRLYARFHDSPGRAYELYSSLGIKQIQDESCSYLVLTDLLRGINHIETSEICWNILSLHARTSKDSSEYALKAYKLGHIETAKEMLEWRRKMSNSLQLKQAKGILLNSSFASATGLIRLTSDTSSSDNVEHLDMNWASKMLKDIDNNFSPSSLLNPGEMILCKHISPTFDHRDFTINHFEILYRFDHASFADICEFVQIRQITHSVLTRMILLEQHTKPLRKGKLPVLTKSDPAFRISQSLLRTVQAGETLMNQADAKVDYSSYVSCLFYLARISCLVCTGQTKVQEDESVADDSIQGRELGCASLLESAGVRLSTTFKHIRAIPYEIDTASFESFSLFDFIMPIFASLLTVEKVCNTFGFGRTKAHAKVGGEALCKFANVLLTILQFTRERSTSNKTFDLLVLRETIENVSCRSMLRHITNGDQVLEDVLNIIQSNQKSSAQYVELIYSQMIKVLNSFNPGC